mmetsp:Transcript_21370/g.24291  ORF Transcript_21370/g.24291 Transcript_21370/m.24291 type:complete len:489 (-) Transcript_21370:82-1548(-)
MVVSFKLLNLSFICLQLLLLNADIVSCFTANSHKKHAVTFMEPTLRCSSRSSNHHKETSSFKYSYLTLPSSLSLFSKTQRILGLHGLYAGSQTEIQETPPSPNHIIPGRPTWQQTMLRISDPQKSIPFYTDIMGMTLIDTLDFPQYKFKLFFLTTLPEVCAPLDDDEEEAGARTATAAAAAATYKLTPGTQEAHDYLWSMDGTALELTYNYGTENSGDDESSSFDGYHAGNEEKDGFGHIAFNTNDLLVSCDALEAAGVTFKKKPNEGRMRNLAFAYDPDGYWIEIIQRPSPPTTTSTTTTATARTSTSPKNTKEFQNTFTFSQTMLRIKDPKKSISFYESLGMKVLLSRHFDDFSLYFLASSTTLTTHDDSTKDDGDDGDDGDDISNLGSRFGPILELTHNHGTENDTEFKHYNGNEEGRQGFGHVGFLVDDVYEACDAIRSMGYGFKKEPDGGSMKGLAFAYDPDGYAVEIIKRGGIEFGDERVVI